MKRNMRNGDGGRQRIQSKYNESDESDDDYKVEDDGEFFEDSDKYCSSLAGEELEDDVGEDEKKKKVVITGRFKRRNVFPSKSKGRVRKASKERKNSYKEDSGDDYVDDSDDMDWRTNFPKRKRNGVQKIVKKKKSSYTEENDGVAELNDNDDTYNENENAKDLHISLPRKKQNGIQKAVKKKRFAYTEENDDDYEAENDASDDDEYHNDHEDEKDLLKGCRSRKQNRDQNPLERKKASYTVEDDDDYEPENDECDDNEDDDYIDNEEEEDLPNGSPKNQNRVQKALKKKSAFMEEDDDDYEAENDECDNDEDYIDYEDEEDLRNGCRKKQYGAKKAVTKKNALCIEEEDDNYEVEDDNIHNVGSSRKPNGAKKALKKKNASYIEENGDDYEVEDDNLQNGCSSRMQSGAKKALKKNNTSYIEEGDDYEVENDDLQNGCSSRTQKVVQKALKKKKSFCMEENDEDYEAEDDEYNDDDEEEELEEEDEELEEELEEEDEDFTSNEIDLDDEVEFPVVKKAKKVRPTPSQGPRGRKRRKARVIRKSKRKNPAKRRRFVIKSSSVSRKKSTKGKLEVDSDSDFADEQLLLAQEYTISEEEREQVREASKICARLDVSFSKNKSREKENLHLERKKKERKGKDKVQDLKSEAVNQVCGICFSEEGKRTIRGTLDCCSHYFCFNCIMEWSKVESRCPLCKQRFSTISKLAKTDSVCDLRTIVVPVPERDQVYQPSEEELRAYIDPYENVICTECHHGGDDANMLLCDLCDSPAHTYCVGLAEVPEGNWYCEGCRPTQAQNFGTTNDLSATSTHSERVRESIDLNRVYEPETVSTSPRPVDDDFGVGSSIQSVLGVQTVSERRRRHQQMAQFVGRNSVSQNPFQSTFSQGLLHDNFVSSLQNRSLNSDIRHVPTMGPLSATTSHSRAYPVWGQTLRGINNGSGDGSGSLQAWSFHGNSSMQ